MTLSSLSTRRGERTWVSYHPEDHPGTVQTWDWRTAERLLGPLSTPSEPVGAAYNADGTALWVLCSGGEIQVIDAKTGDIIKELHHGEETGDRPIMLRRPVQLSPDGRTLFRRHFAQGEAARRADRHAGSTPDAELLCVVGLCRIASFLQLYEGTRAGLHAQSVLIAFFGVDLE